jgi:hypothetical protein
MSDRLTLAQGIIRGAVLLLAFIRPAIAGEERPYSSRMYHDEHRKCAFGNCDQRVLAREQNLRADEVNH